MVERTNCLLDGHIYKEANPRREQWNGERVCTRAFKGLNCLLLFLQSGSRAECGRIGNTLAPLRRPRLFSIGRTPRLLTTAESESRCSLTIWKGLGTSLTLRSAQGTRRETGTPRCTVCW